MDEFSEKLRKGGGGEGGNFRSEKFHCNFGDDANGIFVMNY